MRYLHWVAIGAGLAMMAYSVGNVGLTSRTVKVYSDIPGVPAQYYASHHETRYNVLIPLTGIAGVALVAAALVRMR